MTTPDEVLATAEHLVRSFGTSDLEEYFGCFETDATFVFHTTNRVLGSLAQYREEWATWQHEDGFRVLSCRSSDQRVQDLGNVAVFTHRVSTRTATTGGEDEVAERETIVFRRQDDGRWLGVHEHLSIDPTEQNASHSSSTEPEP